MALTLLPAIDIAGDRVRVAGDAPGTPLLDPLEVALALQAAGAEWLHLVDLDADVRLHGGRFTLEAALGVVRGRGRAYWL